MKKEREKYKEAERNIGGDKNEDMKERMKGIERKLELKDNEERKKI